MADGENPHPFIAPFAAGAALVAPAVLAVFAHQVFLFASLGPTAVMQAQAPERRSSSSYSVIISHIGGFAVATGVVLAFGLGTAPSVFQTGSVSMRRAGAAVLSILVATALEIILRAPHPPAGSTTLLVALGSFKPSWHSFLLVLFGVLAVTAAGDFIRQIRNRLAAAPRAT